MLTQVYRPSRTTRQPQKLAETVEFSEESYSVTPPAAAKVLSSENYASSSKFGPELWNTEPQTTEINVALNLYFKYCHRQPIWCFERKDVDDHDSIPEELLHSILALTSRFAEKLEQRQPFFHNAKTVIMLRVANGMVEITTIESLCLLSYTSFIGTRSLMTSNV